MCGFCGFVSNKEHEQADKLNEMQMEIIHRGPDEQTQYTEGRLSLAFNRLSIVDLTGSTQPLFNESKNLVVLFNGEIYNFHELRKELTGKGHVFVTNGDGEVIPHLFEEYGVDFPKYLHGMFAICLYDQDAGMLWLVRDRFGIKPLFYSLDNSSNKFYFASEIKSITKAVPKELNRDAIPEYFQLRYTLWPQTLYQDVWQVPPSGMLEYDLQDNRMEIHKYWEYPAVRKETLSRAEVIKNIRNLVDAAVKSHLMSDVPVGVFLSGGVDSGVILGSAARQGHKLDAYTVAFPDGIDESGRAAVLAKHFGCKHHIVPVNAEEFFSAWIDAIWHWDAPASEASGVASMLLSKYTKKYCTVVLTGEGSDELFYGYSKYSAELYPGLLNAIRYFSWSLGLFSKPKLKVLQKVLRSKDSLSRHMAWFASLSEDDVQRLVGRTVPAYYTGHNLVDLIRYDREHWLPDDLLAKFDRMTMAYSLEARVPFLDNVLTDYVLSLPAGLNVDLHNRKKLLVEAYHSDFPKDYFSTPKVGFKVPFMKWITEDKQPRLVSLLRESLVVKEGILIKPVYAEMLEKSLRQSDEKTFWSLANFELWFRMHYYGADGRKKLRDELFS